MEKNVCVVTGGTGGIGSATCREFAKQGYAVMLCDVFQDRVDKMVEELRSSGCTAEGMVCDISDKSQTDELARRAAAMGKVVGVVQLAGLTPTFAPAPKILRVDTIGPMNINESFFEIMEGGCIMDICSSTAHFIPMDRWPLENFQLALTDKEAFYQAMLAQNETYPEENNMRPNMAYSWARCFVYWYARQCAYKFGREKGIRVMTVSPGVVRTPMSVADMEKSGADNMARTMSWCALGRPGTPEEAAFLFSTIIDPRNSYLTGADIYFDGGCDAAGYHGQREWYPGTEPKA
jgi:NAD(P)-dependent dehydrogenase (short-subunit alcohol dehydrogenase family)